MDITSYLLGKQAGGGSAPTLQTKSVTITENTTTEVTPDTGYDGLSSVEVTTNVPTSGTVEEKDVNFYDYDGTLLHSYIKDEFLALESMPDNPEREGLTAQGWNWSLTNAKTYVTNNGGLDIGQSYVTSDDKTRIYITLSDGRLSPYTNVSVNGSVTLDWGDGTTETVTGTNIDSGISKQHTYSTPGDYIIKISKNTNQTVYGFWGVRNYGSRLLSNNQSAYDDSSQNTVYRSAVKKIEFGSGVKLGDSACQKLFSLSTVTLPKDILMENPEAFRDCYSLIALIIPSGVTKLNGAFAGYCYTLKCICFSDSIISFSNTSGLASTYGINRVWLPVVNTIQPSILQGSYVKKVIIPKGVTALGSSCLYAAYNIRELEIPDGVTTLQGIGMSFSLTKIKLPKSIINIPANAITNCRALKYVDFSNHEQVPTAGKYPFGMLGSSTMQTPDDIVIIVPDALYEDWKVATNWDYYANNIVKASEV